MVVLAVLTGALTLANFMWWAKFDLSAPLQIVGIAAQAVLLGLTVFAAIRYRGRRSRPSYDRAGYRIWTVSFAAIMVSLLGNLCVLVVLALRMAGVITAL